MNIPVRAATLHASALLIAATCAAACSSTPDGAGEPAAQSTEQAVTRPSCPPGYVIANIGWDTGPTGKPIESWTCEPEPTAATYAGAPASGYSDTCGSTTVATPASLPSTCTLGTVIDGQTVFACPAGTVPPPSLGLVAPTAGLCFTCPAGTLPPDVRVYEPTDGGSDGGCQDNQMDLNMTCEAVLVLSTLSSNCLGSPDAGWEFVVDALEDTTTHSFFDGGQGGGCHGGCAIVAEPPVSNSSAP